MRLGSYDREQLPRHVELDGSWVRLIATRRGYRLMPKQNADERRLPADDVPRRSGQGPVPHQAPHPGPRHRPAPHRPETQPSGPGQGLPPERHHRQPGSRRQAVAGPGVRRPGMAEDLLPAAQQRRGLQRTATPRTPSPRASKPPASAASAASRHRGIAASRPRRSSRPSSSPTPTAARSRNGWRRSRSAANALAAAPTTGGRPGTRDLDTYRPSVVGRMNRPRSPQHHPENDQQLK
jgi:hypothetical protein